MRSRLVLLNRPATRGSPCRYLLSRLTWSSTLATGLLALAVLAGACGQANSSPPKTLPDSTLVILRRGVYATPLIEATRIVHVKSADISSYRIDTLHALRRIGDTTLFGNVTEMRIMDRYLLVSDRQSSPHLLLIDLKDGHLKSAFGRNGQGPGEFLSPSWIQPDTAPRRFWVYDFNNRRLSLLDYHLPEKPVLVSDMSLNLGVSLRRVVVTDTGYIANGLFTDFTLLHMTLAGMPVQRIRGTLPFTIDDGLSPVGLRLTNVSELQLRPNHRDIALAYQFAPKLSFFSLSGASQIEVEGPRPMHASFHTDAKTHRFFWNDDNESAYWGLEATDQFVYALYQGRRDFVKPQPRPDRIHVFTWAGEFVREIVLDTPVSAFVVSADDSRLFGYVEDPHAQIAEWRLPSPLIALRR